MRNNLIKTLHQRSLNDWLVNYDCQDFLQLMEELYSKFDSDTPQKILLVESNPFHFLAGLIAAYSAGHQVFLGNPSWGELEWQKVFSLVQPNLIWGDMAFHVGKSLREQRVGFEEGGEQEVRRKVETKVFDFQLPNLIMIPTGGSSGSIRFAMHSWETLQSSAQGFAKYFQLDKVNSFCILPVYHVSGLMQFIRSFISGGKLVIVPFREVKGKKWCYFEPEEFFISLVPTQLQALLNKPNLTNWLSKFNTVLLGGAPSWSQLINQAQLAQIPISPCYGMTETASQIVTLKPEEFLQGNKSNGKVLPHAQVKIVDETGKEIETNQVGRITIQATSLALGYYPQVFTNPEYFITDDLGYFDYLGYLHLIGRHSDKIITGGENVFPVEIEAAILATGLVEDVAVIGIKDQYWGQVISAIYVPCCYQLESQQIQNCLQGKIAKFKQPKLWFAVEQLPRNAQGKINRQQLRKIVQ